MRLSCISRIGLATLTALTALSTMLLWSTPAHAEKDCNGVKFAVFLDRVEARRITPGFLGSRKKPDDFKIVTSIAVSRTDGNQADTMTYKTPEFKFKNHQIRDSWYLEASGYHCLPDSATAVFSVVALEDDDFALPKLDHILISGAAALGAIITGEPALGGLAMVHAKDAAKDIVKSFDKSPDDPLGAFLVTVTNRGNNLSFNWQPLQHTSMTRFGGDGSTRYTVIDDDWGATFDMRGDSSHYRVNASIFTF